MSTCADPKRLTLVLSGCATASPPLPTGRDVVPAPALSVPTRTKAITIGITSNVPAISIA